MGKERLARDGAIAATGVLVAAFPELVVAPPPPGDGGGTGQSTTATTTVVTSSSTLSSTPAPATSTPANLAATTTASTSSSAGVESHTATSTTGNSASASSATAEVNQSSQVSASSAVASVTPAVSSNTADSSATSSNIQIVATPSTTYTGPSTSIFTSATNWLSSFATPAAQPSSSSSAVAVASSAAATSSHNNAIASSTTSVLSPSSTTALASPSTVGGTNNNSVSGGGGIPIAAVAGGIGGLVALAGAALAFVKVILPRRRKDNPIIHPDREVETGTSTPNNKLYEYSSVVNMSKNPLSVGDSGSLDSENPLLQRQHSGDSSGASSVDGSPTKGGNNPQLPPPRPITAKPDAVYETVRKSTLTDNDSTYVTAGDVKVTSHYAASARTSFVTIDSNGQLVSAQPEAVAAVYASYSSPQDAKMQRPQSVASASRPSNVGMYAPTQDDARLSYAAPQTSKHGDYLAPQPIYAVANKQKAIAKNYVAVQEDLELLKGTGLAILVPKESHYYAKVTATEAETETLIAQNINISNQNLEAWQLPVGAEAQVKDNQKFLDGLKQSIKEQINAIFDNGKFKFPIPPTMATVPIKDGVWNDSHLMQGLQEIVNFLKIQQEPNTDLQTLQNKAVKLEDKFKFITGSFVKGHRLALVEAKENNVSKEARQELTESYQKFIPSLLRLQIIFEKTQILPHEQSLQLHPIRQPALSYSR